MNIKVRQHDITDYGAACLASIAAYYNLKLPIARIRQYASTDRKGTNILGLIEASERLGFSAKGVKGPLESLAKIPKPAIAHIIVKEVLHHFVVIYKVTDKYIQVMDPADGKMHRKTPEEFAEEWTGVLLLLVPAEGFQQGHEGISVTKRFWQLVRPHRTVMIQAVLGAVVYTILWLSTSVYVQKIIDYVLVEGNNNLLNLLSVTMIILLLLQIFIGSAKSIFALKTGQQIDAQLILGYYKHLLKLPQQFFDTMRVGEIILRVNDAVKIRVFINDVVLNAVVNVFIVLFSFGLMFTYYWKLALIMLAIIPLYSLLYWIVNKVNKRIQRSLMEHSADLEAQLVESLNTVVSIKRFGIEDHANMHTETRFVTLLQTLYKSGIQSLYAGNAAELTSRLFTIILLWAGATFVMEQTITAGELLSFYALIGYFTGPAVSLIGMNKGIQDALIAADRLFEIMDLEREQTTGKIELARDMVGDIQFKDVSFRYGSKAPVFDGLNLEIAKGRITAVVGESGSGKSTLLSLVQNLYPLKKGQITIGGYDIKHISNHSLRTMISVVPQQIDLFSGTVLENIALGDYSPDMKWILTISAKLGITEFVEQLPAGFHTQIGENGATLSGGQRQRLAIARALYKDPEVLILDEATSALDSISEKYVQSTIQVLRQQGKTVIIIAHRLSTIKNADTILVLDKGKLVELGTHRDLITSQGKYAKLWSAQTVES
jgi:ABC-type bacteriocin/lantibiotic exporters, contain an N-terminal double-glycine peptidase domain